MKYFIDINVKKMIKILNIFVIWFNYILKLNQIPFGNPKLYSFINLKYFFIKFILLFFSINFSLCIEHDDSFNPSNNGHGIIALVLLICLFGHFMYYTLKPSISVDEENNVMYGPEPKPMGLNSIQEVDLFQILNNWEYFFFGVLLLLLVSIVLVIIFIISNFTTIFQGKNQLYNVIVNDVWFTKVKFVVMSFLNMLHLFPFIKTMKHAFNVLLASFGFVSGFVNIKYNSFKRSYRKNKNI